MKKNKFCNYEFRILVKPGFFLSQVYEPQYRRKLSFLSYTWYTGWQHITTNSTVHFHMDMQSAKEAIADFVLPASDKILAFMPVDINDLKPEQ